MDCRRQWHNLVCRRQRQSLEQSLEWQSLVCRRRWHDLVCRRQWHDLIYRAQWHDLIYRAQWHDLVCSRWRRVCRIPCWRRKQRCHQNVQLVGINLTTPICDKQHVEYMNRCR